MNTRERGFTLIVGMLFLILLTLMAIGAFRLGSTNFELVAANQARNESNRAAEQVLEEVLSSTSFTTSPTNLFGGTGCSSDCNVRNIDTNGDANPDVKVTISTPTCVKAQAIKQSNLDLTINEDFKCSIGISQNFGVVGGDLGDSLCANTVWEMTATAVDNVQQSTAVVVQGVGVRVPADNLSISCP